MTEKTRPCPDCKGQGVDRKSAGGIFICVRCQGGKVIIDLGACVGPVYAEGRTLIPCPFRADRAYHGQLLCDGHALGVAIETKMACPTCGGNPAKGMHRGEVIGHGKVMTCSSSQHERDLSDISHQLQQALRSVPRDDDEPGGWVSELDDSGRLVRMSIAVPEHPKITEGMFWAINTFPGISGKQEMILVEGGHLARKVGFEPGKVEIYRYAFKGCEVNGLAEIHSDRYIDRESLVPYPSCKDCAILALARERDELASQVERLRTPTCEECEEPLTCDCGERPDIPKGPDDWRTRRLFYPAGITLHHVTEHGITATFDPPVTIQNSGYYRLEVHRDGRCSIEPWGKPTEDGEKVEDDEPLLHDYPPINSGDDTCRACGNVRKYGDAPQAQCRGTKEPEQNVFGLHPIFSDHPLSKVDNVRAVRLDGTLGDPLPRVVDSFKPDAFNLTPDGVRVSGVATFRPTPETSPLMAAIEKGEVEDVDSSIAERICANCNKIVRIATSLPFRICHECFKAEEEDDGQRDGDECLTDGERNPSMGGQLTDEE